MGERDSSDITIGHNVDPLVSNEEEHGDGLASRVSRQTSRKRAKKNGEISAYRKGWAM
jgi:hypothetical protein